MSARILIFYAVAMVISGVDLNV